MGSKSPVLVRVSSEHASSESPTSASSHTNSKDEVHATNLHDEEVDDSESKSTTSQHHVDRFPSSRFPPPLLLKDLECVRILGSSSYGSILLVRVRPREIPHPFEQPGTLLAMKVYKRNTTSLDTNTKRSPDIYTEREVLHKLPWSAWITTVIDAFDDSVNLYLLVEYIQGVTLHDVIYKYRLQAEMARFYYANIACALQFLHSNEIVHSDLRPTNILIKPDGYICLVEFGLARSPKDVQTSRIAGTPAYMAPELFGNVEHHDGYGVDWWSSGIVLYEMLSQRVPFSGETEEEVQRCLDRNEFRWPSDMYIGKALHSFVSSLLQYEPKKRLGGTKRRVSKHPWLADIDWKKLRSRDYVVPWAPNAMDTSQQGFDTVPEQDTIPGLQIAT